MYWWYANLTTIYTNTSKLDDLHIQYMYTCTCILDETIDKYMHIISTCSVEGATKGTDLQCVQHAFCHFPRQAKSGNELHMYIHQANHKYM